MIGEELWEMWCVHMCEGFIYIGHLPTLGCLLLIHLPCCYNAFHSFRECPDFISYSWRVHGLVSAYGKEKSCCHGQSLVGSL